MGVLNKVAKVIGGVKNVANETIGTAIKVANTDEVKNIGSTIGNAVGTGIATGIKNGVEKYNDKKNVYQNFFNAVGDKVGGFVNNATNKVGEWYDATKEKVGSYAEGLKSMYDSIQNATEETSPMTYQEYFDLEKTRLEEERQQALKDAQTYKERAAADAQASYMQNMSTYGVNAETMAQMGLTGGGYSDYLNSQTYAQKRSDMQTADRNKLAMEQAAETTYADNIAALNKEKFAYEEQDHRYSQNAYTELLSAVQNSSTSGNYNEEGLRALGKQWGWTNKQIDGLISVWSDANKSEEDVLDSEDEIVNIGDVIKDIQNGLLVKKDGTSYSWEEIHEMLLQGRNAGEKITNEDIAKAKSAYDARRLYSVGVIPMETYYNALNGDEDAIKTVNMLLKLHIA